MQSFLLSSPTSMLGWITFNSMLIALLVGLGVGIGLAAALLTYRQCRVNNAGSDAERQDALERFKVWNDFWKYFLVSFALVLITTLLGNTLKERELALQKAQQENALALENAKQTSASLIAENTNLGSFLDRALVDSWQKQYAFASYFSHLTRDPEAKQRWSDYALFIEKTQQEASTLQAKQINTDIALSKLAPSDPKRADLEAKREEVQSKLDLNKAILQTPISLSIKGINIVDGGTLYQAGLTIDVGGSPHAYHPDNKSGLDFLQNAGRPGNWWEVVTDDGTSGGNPVVQSDSDPAPGFYIAPTALTDPSKDPKDPRRYVDSETVAYIDVPTQLRTLSGVKPGDFAAVLNTRNQKFCYAIVAGYASSMEIGKGSIALAKALGLSVNARQESVDGGIIYKAFPGSGSGWPKTNAEINSEAERLFRLWGGQERMLIELKGRTGR
jgi:Fungal chitosanase of glycosyl hydrolase group 75